MEFDPLLLNVIINGVLEIIDRHKKSGTPYTAESVHAELIAELQKGQSTIAQEFTRKGWTLPQ